MPLTAFIALVVCLAIVSATILPSVALADETALASPAPTAVPSQQAPGVAPAAPTGSTDEQAASAAQAGGNLTAAQLQALAKQTQNPVGNIAVFPFQNNWNYRAGPTGVTVWNMNMQPVVPFMLSPKLNLIERAIVPVVNVPALVPVDACQDFGLENSGACSGQLGISNIQLQSFFAPRTKPGALIWGAGPIFSFPTVTKNLGSQQFGAGVDAVGLTMPGSWVIGSLFTQRWYVAGPSAPPNQTINSFLAQPFFVYNFGKGWAVGESPIITANWNEPGNQKWTVPVGLQLTNTNTWLKLPMSYTLAYYGNVVRPANAPFGLIRFSWSLIWPVKRGQ